MFPSLGFATDPTYPISSEVYTTRQQTVRPVALPDGTPELVITDVSQYDTYGYSHWSIGQPNDYGPLLPDGSAPGTRTKVEAMLNFFTMTDIHITDKESTAQIPFLGTVSSFGDVNTSGYSPVIMSTTHVLDAAVQTINALHAQNNPSFDFGLALGDESNNTQYNELRWFIDTMDGKKINPSSGAHLGSKTIDYQQPYQTAGLDKSIPWYAVIGNHDQWWIGTLAYTDYVRKVLTSNTVMDIGFTGSGSSFFPTFDQRGFYVGVVNGATPYGDITGYGPEGSIAQPVVAADKNRRSLTTDTSTTLNWMKEFFNTTSKPKGHGFGPDNLRNDFASYTFEPKSSVPIKVIVLDDTCKTNPYGNRQAQSYARGCLDQDRYQWLVNELELGQAQGKLMIIAAHIPVGPQWNVPDAPPGNPPLPNNMVVPLFIATCNEAGSTPAVPCQPPTPLENNSPVPPYSVVTDATLLQTLHNYSNVILWLSGHRHINTVTPQPAPAGKGPEFGFWLVETSSLRDFPQMFRTFQIQRNAENTLSMFITNVDPAVESTSPAGKSRGYAIGVARIAAGNLTDTTSHVFNGELIKPLAAPYTMTVNVVGPGTVKMGPYQAATCSSSTPCTGSFLPGTEITLTPVASSGAVLVGWSPCTGTSTCTISMNSNVTVTATFMIAPTVSVSPSYKDFGTLKVGKTRTATFTVKNTAAKGIAQLTLGTITITGSSGARFSIVAGKDNCSGKTIQSGKACTFQAAFTPTGANSVSAIINLPSNDPSSPASVQVWGAGK